MNTTSSRPTGDGRGISKLARRLFCAAAATAVLLPQGANAAWVAQSGTGARHDSNVHFIDANTGWFTAGTKVRKTTDGGATWVEQNPVTGDGLTGIHFVDANTGWATGYFGTVRKTTNGGASWSTQTHPTGAHCWGVFALNSSLAWQAGSSGMLGRTTNGGATWLGTEGNPSGNPGFGQYDVHFTDANTGYSVAGGNWSAKTVNGGVTWTQMSTSNSAQLYKVTFADANTGWAVGASGTIVKTTNAGASWTTQTSGTSQTLTGVSFVNANTGWVVGGNGTILSTVNGGTTWTPETSGTTEYLGDVHFVDATHGWVVGNNNTVLKYDAGAPPAATDVVFVANHSGSTIRKFTAPGVSTVFADSADGLSGPEGIAFDSAGNMFVTNSGNSTVVKILPNGAASVFADSADGISQPYGIAIDAANNLYVGNAGSLTVTKLSPAGVGTVLGSCSGPFVRGVAVDSTGNVYVSNAGSKIERFTPAGSRTTYYDGAVLSHSNGLTFDGAGVLYCADFNQNKVVKFATPGVPTTFANTLMSSPLGIRFGTDGKLYVANYGGSSVTNYTTAGAGTTFANSGNGVSGPTAVGIFSPPAATTLIDDKFDDGVIGTNTLGVGTGFVSYSQTSSSTESGGFLNLDVDSGAATRTYVSRPADAVNPFGTGLTTQTFDFGSISRSTSLQRFWVGYRKTGSTTHFFPNMGVQGLYLSVLSQNVGEDGFTRHGNLIAVSHTGAMTTLASWTWANPDALSGLVATLKTTATTFELSFSGAAGGVPTYAVGGATGTLTGLGTLTTNFDTGIYNQYWGGTGGGIKVDRVRVQQGTVTNTPPVITLPASPLIAEATSASGAVVTYAITGTDAESGALTGSGVPASGSTFALGDTTVTGTVTDGTLTATGTFIVRVRDTTAPTVTAPANVTIAATSGAGAVVTYPAATASDAVTASPSINYSKASGTLFPVGTTTVNITAADAAGNTAPASFTVTVTPAAQTISFTNPGAKTFGDAPFALVATGGASGQPVTFQIVSGPATVAGSTLTITGAGDVTVRASQAGNANYLAAADVDQTFAVAKATQAISFAPLGGKTFGDAPFALVATGGASGEPVTFQIVSGSATVAGSTVTITGAGDVTVRASQAGNANYLSAAAVDRTFTVAKATQAITFTLPTNAIVTASLTLNATGGAGTSPVTYSIVSGPGVIAGNALTFSAEGPVVVRASQAGDANYEAATDVNASTTVIGVPTRWQGLLYTAGGDIGGYLSGTRVISNNTMTASIKSGTSSASATLSFGTSQTGTTNTPLGTLTVTLNSDGTLGVALGTTLSGTLQAGLTATTARQLNVALASSNATIPGGGWVRVNISEFGTFEMNGKMPDNRAFSASGRLAVDDTMEFYSFATGAVPAATVGGKLRLASLPETDVTGDIAWNLPPQTNGTYLAGINTSVSAAGSLYYSYMMNEFDGSGTLFVNGGSVAPTTRTVSVFDGKPTVSSTTTAPVTGWEAPTETNGSGVPKLKLSGIATAVKGSGVYLPKSKTFWGIFGRGGTTGRVVLTIP